MGQQDAFCSICGGPFNCGDVRAKWTHNALLMTAVEPDANGKLIPASFRCQEAAAPRQVMRIPATFDEGAYFCEKTTPGSQRLRAFSPLRIASGTDAGLYGPLYFPVHECCMKLMDGLASQRNITQESSTGDIKDDTRLWEVLESRFRNTFVLNTGSHVRDCSNMPEPHDYFGAERCRNISWEADDDPEAAVIFEADPCWVETESETTSNSSRNRERILKILTLAKAEDLPKRVPAHQRTR